MHIDSEVSPIWQFVQNSSTPPQVFQLMHCFGAIFILSGSFFSFVRLISFLVVSAKMSGWNKCRIKLHRRPRKEIRISAQVWFQTVNGLCLAEFKQWPSGQMGDKFSPIFRSLRRTARHDVDPVQIGSRELGHDLVRLRHSHPGRILSVGIWTKTVITLLPRDYRAQAHCPNTNSERCLILPSLFDNTF